MAYVKGCKCDCFNHGYFEKYLTIRDITLNSLNPTTANLGGGDKD